MSNVLDENVVILKFDNSDFKKNTEESISSLDKLTDRLHKSNSAKGLENLGKATKSFNLDNMSNAVDKVNKRFSLFGVAGMSVINNLTNSAISSVKGLMTAVPGQMIQGGWRRALNIEQAEFLMEGLGVKFEGTFDKFTGKFEGVKGAVLAAVNDTRYGLDEAAKTASQLMASGVQDVDELASRLKAISGLASVTNSEFSDIGRIFTQVAGQGRMMGDDLLQISQRGINAAAQIKDYLNANKEVKQQALDNAVAMGNQVKKMQEISTHAELTEGDIRDMVSAGAISFDVFASSFEKFFAQAQKANDTYEGSLANVRAALSRMGAQFEETKLKNMTKIFNTLLPVLKRFEDFIAPFTDKINKASTKVAEFITEGIINPIGLAIGVKPENLFHGFGKAAEKASTTVSKANTKTQKSNEKMTKGLRVTAKEWQAALDIWNKGTYGNDQKRADAIRKLGMSYENVQGIINKFYAAGFDWSKVEHTIVDETKQTSEATEQLGESAEQAASKLSTLGTVVKGIMNFATAVKNVLTGFKNILVGAGGLIKSALVGPAKAGSNAFLSLTDYLVKATDKFAKFTKTLSKPQGIRVFFDKQFEKLPNVFKLVFGALGDGISWITSHIGPAFKTIKEFFSELSASEGVTKLKEVFSDLSKSTSDLASSGLSTVISKIRDLANIGSGSGGMQKLVKFFSDLAGSLADFISKVRGGANPFKLITDGFSGLKGKFSFGGVKGGIGASISNAFDLSGIEKIGAKIKNIRIGEKLRELFEDLGSFGKQKIQDFKFGDFLKNLSEKLGEVDWGKITELGTKIAGLVLAFKAFRDMDALTNAAVGTMGSMSGFFESLGGLSDAVKKRIKIDTFKTVAICIAILIGAVVVLTQIPVQKWAPALGGVLAMMVTLTAIVALLTSDKFDAEKVKAVGIAFAGMGASILLLGLGMLAIAKLKVGDMIKAGLAIVAFTGMLVLASKLSGDIRGAGGAFIGLATAVNLLLVAMLGFAALSTGVILKGGLVILGLVTSLALAARIAGGSKPGGFISMATAVNQLIPAIVTFALMPMERILKGGLTVVGLITALAAAARLAGNGSLKGLAGISVTVAVLTGSMVVLSMIDTERLIASGSALVGLMTSMAIAAKLAQKSTTGILAMAAMLAVLTASLYILSSMDIQSSLATCAMLSLLAVSLGAAMAIFAAIGPGATVVGVAGLAVAIAGVGAILFAIGKLDEKLEKYDIKGFIDRGIPILNSVASGLGQMIGSFVSGLMASALTGGLPVAARNLSLFMTELQPFFEAAKDKKSITTALGSIKAMTEAFSLLGSGNMKNAVAEFLGGDVVDMEEFGKQMADFAKAFKKFAKEAGKIDERDLAAAYIVSKIAAAFAQVQASFESTGGLKGLIMGNKEDLGTFGEQFGSIIESVGTAVESIRGYSITDKDVEAIKPILKIINAFAGLELPKSGGLLQGITGNTTIGEFGQFLSDFITQFEIFLPKLRDLDFSDNVLGEGGNLAKVVSVIKTMVTAGEGIPPTDGLAQVVTGQTTLADFAKMLVEFVPKLEEFVTKTAELDEGQLDAALPKVAPIANAVAAMANAAASLPPSGGVKQGWSGGQDLGNFATQLNTFAEKFDPFVQTVSDMTIPKNISTKIKQLADAVTQMAAIAKAVPDDESVFSKLKNLVKLKIDEYAVKAVVRSIKTISENSEGIVVDDVTKLSTAVKQISGMAGDFKALGKIPTGANLPILARNIASYISEIGNVNTKGIDKKAADVRNAINKLSKAANTKIKVSSGGSNTAAGKAIGDAYIKGINSTLSSVRTAAGKLPKTAAQGVKGSTSSFRSAGKNCGQAFADGILAKKSTIGAAGTSIGNYAYKKAMAAIDAHSPSRKFIKLGNYAGEGFVIGMKALQSRVGDTGYDMAMESVYGAQSAISAIDDLSSPVITPVIDMSKVETGAQQINNLLTSTKALDVNSIVEGNLTAQYERAKSMDKLVEMMGNPRDMRPNQTNNYNNITVDGSENPELFAERLMRGLEIRTRSM